MINAGTLVRLLNVSPGDMEGVLEGLDDVFQNELEDIGRVYKKVAGFETESVNVKPNETEDASEIAAAICKV
ncbi:hypothetical protein CTA1_11030 [Colletotrichum tanaceti]|uniref:Uncharacterized protein n=1 Tax=Colletotrichum tanaceti TaxID=1306861 RepID=A0A4U6XA66_9PEZI|nr:hypothetical protein CTA1_11030 [Colletotrichum tanaceti]